MTRRKFTSRFKTEVVLESLKERHSLSDLAQRYQNHHTQISSWKRDFPNGTEQVFKSGKKDKRSEADKENDRLIKAIVS